MYPSQIHIVESKPSLSFLLKKIEDGSLILKKNFKDSWDEQQASAFVESILARIPVYPVYGYFTNVDNKTLIVDGYRRLEALKRFFVDKSLKLNNLVYFKDFHDFENGFGVDEIPLYMKSRIEDTYITFYTIEFRTPEDVLSDLIKRIHG